MSDIFISYSSEDKSLVRQLAGILEQKGWSVWWDRKIPAGQDYNAVIEQELNQSKCVLVIWTLRSVASQYVKAEAGEALRQKKMVPIIMEALEVPLAFRNIESAMLIDWDGEEDHPELQILFQSIKNIIEQKNESLPPEERPESYEKRKKRKALIKLVGTIIGIMLIIFVIKKIIPPQTEKIVTIRVYDWKKNPINHGNVKLYLHEYIRNQSIDDMGQALFAGVPAEILKNKVKLEVSSQGYTTTNYDTLINPNTPLELILPFTTVVFISGIVKTAAEIPIRGVEVSVEGTKYFDISRTDGAYKIRLEEYTIGDEVTILTSHPDFEDKLFTLKLSSPQLENQHIFLNPNH
jgi:hypothetical protein